MKRGAHALALLALPALCVPAVSCPLGAYGVGRPIEELCPFKEGLARIAVGKKWGFIDRAGKVAIAPQFDWLDDFSDGYAVAGVGDLNGVIDRHGEWAAQPQFATIGRFDGGMAPASRDLRTTGYIDHAGKWVIAPRFASAQAFVGDLAAVLVDDMRYTLRYTLIDRKGRIVKRLPRNTEIVPDARFATLLHATQQGRAMLVHLDGRRRTLAKDADIDAYKKQHAILMDVEALPRQTSGANGLMPTRKGELWGLADAKGKWVTPPVLEIEPRPFIYKQKLLGWSSRLPKFDPIPAGEEMDSWLTPGGKLVAGRPVHQAITFDAASRLLTVNADDRFDSVMTNQGTVRIAPMYAALTPLRGGWFLAEPRKLHGLIDQRGHWQVTPRRFDMHNQSALRPYMIQFKGAERELLDLHGRPSVRAAPRALGQEEPSQSWWIDFTHHFLTTGYTQFNGFDFKPRLRIAGGTQGIQFSEGVIGFSPSDPRFAGYMGLADDSGKTLGMYRHTSIDAMHDGMAVTGAPIDARGENSARHFGYIDRAGRLAIRLRFAQAGDFSEGRATVAVHDGMALIDKSGSVLLHGAWGCGTRQPVLLDGMNTVVWPKDAHRAGKCQR